MVAALRGSISHIESSFFSAGRKCERPKASEEKPRVLHQVGDEREAAQAFEDRSVDPERIGRVRSKTE